MRAYPYIPSTFTPYGKNAQNKGINTYRFLFNGQERDDEIYGEGNSYTAEYWQYDPRLGRRWNVDPVVKPHRSPYDAFSNNPIVRVDPKGDDDYYNKNGEYIGSDGKGTAIRVMDNNHIQTEADFNKYMAVAKNLNADVESFRNKISRVIKFEDAGDKFAKMSKLSEKDGRERIGYFVFDAKNATVSFEVAPETGEPGANEVELKYKSGNVYEGDPNKTVLGNLHTHPKENNMLGRTQAVTNKVITDQLIFEYQYSASSGDGPGAATDGHTFSLSTNNVDYYAPEGIEKSQNAVTTTKDLSANKFNLGKYALEKYGKK